MSKDDKVLVPQVGKEKEFYKALEDAENIANGTLGWRGQAEIMVDSEIEDVFEVELPKDKSERIAKVEELLKLIYLETILQYGEELTVEEAKKRKRTTKVLYGE